VITDVAVGDPFVGGVIATLDTPQLTVDLEAVERNINRMQRYCDDHGFAFRPHVKTHKLPQIAWLQIEAGAVGICSQKLGEAEVMAAAGLKDILIAYPLVGEAKAQRLATLASAHRVSTVGDSPAVARSLSRALARVGATVEFLVECDTGFHRTGVQSPREALELALLVESLPGLRFAGFMTYPTLPESGPWLHAARKALERAGLRIERVSGGGTLGAFQTHEVGGITEIRAGTYVYGDRTCLVNGFVSREDCALRVLATVISRPTAGRAIIDTGSKTLTNDPAPGATGFGEVVEYPEADVYLLNEEHGYVDVGACARKPEIGEVVTIIPNHACGTANMHDEVVVHSGGKIVAVWPVAARGKLR
jgi:D-serine deaminase-like pyridoxal phosphate-dependent protein